MTTENLKLFKLGPLQQKWLDALKSGKYNKGRTLLRSFKEEFCCLGVACEAIGIEPIKNTICLGYLYGDCTTLIPKEAMEKFKLLDRFGSFSTKKSSLVDINDDESPSGTFKEVIEVFENTPELIFTEPA